MSAFSVYRWFISRWVVAFVARWRHTIAPGRARSMPNPMTKRSPMSTLRIIPAPKAYL